MTSPVPYSKPKRPILHKKRVKFKTKRGSFVYAPHTGVLTVDGNKIRIVTDNKYVHLLKNVKFTGYLNRRKVLAGERIGVATRRRVIYSRYRPDKKEVDAIAAVKRHDNKVKADEYFRRARRVSPKHTPGVMGPGKERKVVWHTSESDWRSGIDPVTNWVQMKGSQYTLLWNPYEKRRSERFRQLYSSHDGARSLKNDGDYGTNRHGEICIQICVIGRAADKPLSKSPMYGRRELMEWIDYHDIPRKLIFDQSNPLRSRKQWEKDGHATHRVCPGNDHTDPGYINTKKLFGP